jgi:hypothetical protein
VAALADFVSGEWHGDFAVVVVTNPSAAQTYLDSLSGAEPPLATSDEWVSDGNRVGKRAYDTLRGVYVEPPPFDSTSARLEGGGLFGC